MQRSEAEMMMKLLMAQHGLWEDGWRFAWMNRLRTLGLCQYRNKQLLLSTIYVDRHDEDHVRQTCLHEIAHALTPGAKHGPEWEAKARELGVRNPARCTAADMPAGKYQAHCPTCNKMYSLIRKPKAGASTVRYCPPCYKIGGLPASRLDFTNSRAVSVSNSSPVSAVNVPVSARNSSPVQTVRSVSVVAPSALTAPELAEKMGVDAKSLRAWLRKDRAWADEYKRTGAWLFPSNRVQDIVDAWNVTH